MALEKIILKNKNKKFSLAVDSCNLLKQFFGLMIFKKRALLLFNFKKPKRTKIHSFFCSPFLAVYTNGKNEIQEITKITSWKPMVLPVDKFNKLIEIPLIYKYSKLTKSLLKIHLPFKNNKFPTANIIVHNRNI